MMFRVGLIVVVCSVLLLTGAVVSMGEEYMTESGDVREPQDGEYMADSGEVYEKDELPFMSDDDSTQPVSGYGAGSDTIADGDIGQSQDGLGCSDNDMFGEGDLEELNN